MDVIGVLCIMLNGLWLFVPAMLSNTFATMFGGKTKIDFGKSWHGKRIFGDGKSWSGFIGGGFSAACVGFVIIGISYLTDSVDTWGYGEFYRNIGIVLCLAYGALFGDLCAAFIKRRLGMERGHKAPILDQYDFVAGAFLITTIFFHDWIFATYFDGWRICAFIIILLTMFFIHRIANIIGYKIGLKKEPW